MAAAGDGKRGEAKRTENDDDDDDMIEIAR